MTYHPEMTFDMLHECILVSKVAFEIHYITNFAFVIFHLKTTVNKMFNKNSHLEIIW